MDTKQKILKKSLELFNQKGTAQTTVRHIAAALNISHGNLCYHYENTGVIIGKLYEELVEALNKRLGEVQTKNFSLTDLLRITETVFDIFYQYRFILLEFVHIMRRLPGVRTHFRELQKRRAAEFQAIFQLMQQKGYLKEEPLPGHFTRLTELMMIVGNFWISEAEIIFKGSQKATLTHYALLFNSLMVPYLTEKGLEEYRAYNGGA